MIKIYITYDKQYMVIDSKSNYVFAKFNNLGSAKDYMRDKKQVIKRVKQQKGK